MFLGRWIKFERTRLKEKKIKIKKREREEGDGAQSTTCQNTVATTASSSSPELSGGGATVHGFRFRLNWEKEESDASPFHPINAVEEAVSEKVHGGAMNVPVGARGTRTPSHD